MRHVEYDDMIGESATTHVSISARVLQKGSSGFIYKKKSSGRTGVS